MKNSIKVLKGRVPVAHMYQEDDGNNYLLMTIKDGTKKVGGDVEIYYHRIGAKIVVLDGRIYVFLEQVGHVISGWTGAVRYTYANLPEKHVKSIKQVIDEEGWLN